MSTKKSLASILGVGENRVEVDAKLLPKTLQPTISPNIGRVGIGRVNVPKTNSIQRLADALKGISPILNDYRETQQAEAEIQISDFQSKLSQAQTEQERQTIMNDLNKRKGESEKELNKRLKGQYSLNPLATIKARKLMGHSMSAKHEAFKQEALETYKKEIKAKGNVVTQEDIIKFLDDTDKKFFTENNMTDPLMREGLYFGIKPTRTRDLADLRSTLGEYHETEVLLPNLTDNMLKTFTSTDYNPNVSSMSFDESNQAELFSHNAVLEHMQSYMRDFDILDTIEKQENFLRNFVDQVALEDAELVLSRLELLDEFKIGNEPFSNKMKQIFEIGLEKKIENYEAILDARFDRKFDDEFGETLASLHQASQGTITYDDDGSIIKIEGGTTADLDKSYSALQEQIENLPTDTKEQMEYAHHATHKAATEYQRTKNIIMMETYDVLNNTQYSTEFYNDNIHDKFTNITNDIFRNPAKYGLPEDFGNPRDFLVHQDSSGNVSETIYKPQVLRIFDRVLGKYNFNANQALQQTSGIQGYDNKINYISDHYRESDEPFFNDIASNIIALLKDPQALEDLGYKKPEPPPETPKAEEIDIQLPEEVRGRFMGLPSTLKDYANINMFSPDLTDRNPDYKNIPSFSTLYDDIYGLQNIDFDNKDRILAQVNHNANILVANAMTELNNIEARFARYDNGKGSLFTSKQSSKGVDKVSYHKNLVYKYNNLLPARGVSIGELTNILSTYNSSVDGHYTNKFGIPIFPSTIEKIKNGEMPIVNFKPNALLLKELADKLGISVEQLKSAQMKIANTRSGFKFYTESKRDFAGNVIETIKAGEVN